MSYKPTDFFIGVMEFFAILMPGALLAFLLTDWGTPLFGDLLPALPGAAGKWIAFLIISYVLGHLLHHLGGIIDKWIYGRLYVKQWKRRKGEERLLTKTRELMDKELGKDANMTNAFSWAASYVRVHNAAAASELERGGAESKFFRSLAFVAVVAMVLFASKSSLLATLGALILLVFSLWRFCDRRWKNVQLTYEYFIMLKMAEDKKASKSNSSASSA